MYFRLFHSTRGNNVKQIKLSTKERGIMFSRYGHNLFHRFNENMYRSLILLRADKDDQDKEAGAAQEAEKELIDQDNESGKMDNPKSKLKPPKKGIKPRKKQTPPRDPPKAQGAERENSQIGLTTVRLNSIPLTANTINGYKRPSRINTTIYCRFLNDTDSFISQSFRRVVVERIWNSTRNKLLKNNCGLTQFFVSLDFLNFFWRSVFSNSFNLLVLSLFYSRRLSCSSKLSEIKTHETRLDLIRGRTIRRFSINSRIRRRMSFIKSFVRQLALPPTLVKYAMELATTYVRKVGQVDGYLDQTSFNIKFFDIDDDGKPKIEEMSFNCPEFINANGFSKEWDQSIDSLYEIVLKNKILSIFLEECSQCFQSWELKNAFEKFERECGRYDVFTTTYSCQSLLRQNSFIGETTKDIIEYDFRKTLCNFGSTVPFRVNVVENEIKLSFKELLFSDTTFDDEIETYGLIYKYKRGRFPGAFYYKATDYEIAYNHVPLFNLDIDREIRSDGFVKDNQRERLYRVYYDRSVYEAMGFCRPGDGYTYFHPTLGWVFADLRSLESLVDDSLADIFDCDKEKNWIEDVLRIIVADSGNRSFSI